MAPKVYSLEVPGTESAEKGWGPIHRGVDLDPPMLGIRDRDTRALVTTSWENFLHARLKYPNDAFLGHRPFNPDGSVGDYVWQTFAQVGKRCEAIGSGLVNLGLCPPNPGDTELMGRGLLGFYSKNRPEWVIVEQACYSQAIVPCPSYDTLGADSIAYVVNQTSMLTMLCSAEVIHNMIECKSQCPSLKYLIQMEKVDDELRAKGEAVGLKIFSMDEVEANGMAQPMPLNPPSPKDIATFCYTSGTTGDPKGALLSHESMISDVASFACRFDINHDDIHLSYLPLPHVFERCMQISLMTKGAKIGFYQGDTLKILEDLNALRPTIFPSVPRLLNRIHDRLKAQVAEAGGLKKTLFDRAYHAKQNGLRAGTNLHPLWDRLVFNKIKVKVGLDRVRMIITGSAPIANHVLDFLRIVFCCPVMEGYGMTETGGGATVTAADDMIPGTVGPPLPVNEIRLQDVPDMGYLRTDQVHGKGSAAIPCCGRGEICFRGTNIFSGYYKMPEKTAEAIDAEGWLHSGDIGLWTPDGRLKIIDRKKNIFKLQQGEYVAPEKIENVNGESKYIAQSFVYGDSLQVQLVSIIVPDPDEAAKWAKENGKAADLKVLCKDEAFIKVVLEDIRKIGAKAKFMGYEIIKAVYLEPNPWVPGSDVLTPTFKLQRSKAGIVYQPQIDEMYAKLDAAPSSKL